MGHLFTIAAGRRQQRPHRNHIFSLYLQGRLRVRQKDNKHIANSAFDPDDVGNKFPGNIVELISDYTASPHRR
jgi:hypothetical protein